MDSHDRNQLAPSIEKLAHYLAIYGKHPTTVSVKRESDGDVVFSRTYPKAGHIAISPTLYSRIDNCHGAGNCCRVPFDLVYTEYDKSRIDNYDHDSAIRNFGKQSAESFLVMRENLLKSLERYIFKIVSHEEDGDVESVSNIYVRRNLAINKLSGRKSCPYLTYSDDRYYCGVHPFKPLHCWYPHMVVRFDAVSDPMTDLSSIMIGRMQYGRNHNFGCPVIFEESSSGRAAGLFEDVSSDTVNIYYLDGQFADDISKLEWTAKSAASAGFSLRNSYVVDIHNALFSKREEIASRLASGEKSAITLWKS